jgi:hypothetical protein
VVWTAHVLRRFAARCPVDKLSRYIWNSHPRTRKGNYWHPRFLFSRFDSLGQFATRKNLFLPSLFHSPVSFLFSLNDFHFLCCSLFFSAAFYVAILYHTSYAIPWVYPPIAVYGLDILLRMLRYRFRDATLVPIGNQVTLVRSLYCAGFARNSWMTGTHTTCDIWVGRWTTYSPTDFLFRSCI